MITIYLIAILIVLLTIIYLNFKSCYNFWSSRNVPSLPVQFPFGNFNRIFKVNYAVIIRELYEEFKKQDATVDYAGIYLFKKPILLVTSSKFAKKILTDDFKSFVNRGLYYNQKDDPLSGHLFFLENSKWETLREKFNDAFIDYNKLEHLVPNLVDTTENLIEYLEKSLKIDKVTATGQGINVNELSLRFNSDLLSSCIFGIDDTSLKESPEDTEFLNVGRKILTIYRSKIFFVTLGMMYKNQAKQLGFKIFDKDIHNYFDHLTHEMIGFRKENNFHRGDIMQSMIELIEKSNHDASNNGFNLNQIVSNSFGFYFIALEMCSKALFYSLWHLSENESIQNELRAEIQNLLTTNEEKISYEILNRMKYLEMFIFETLRMHPIFPTIHRVTNVEYTLPNKSIIPKDTAVIIPVFGMHYDPTIYPDPEKFDPKRFSYILNETTTTTTEIMENPHDVESNIEKNRYNFLPFGEGPRACIGRKLAIILLKIGLVVILKNFQIDKMTKTQKDETTDETTATTKSTAASKSAIDKNSLTLASGDDLWLKFDRIGKT